MTPAEVVRKAIPEATDELCDYVLWERTAFPVGKTTARSLYEAAHRLRRAAAKSLRLCIFCDRIAQGEDWECADCKAALAKVAAKPS